MNETEHKARALGKEEACIFDNKTISQFTARPREDVPSMDAFPKLLCSPLHRTPLIPTSCTATYGASFCSLHIESAARCISFDGLAWEWVAAYK
jgi:hypothetical protein